MGLLPLEFTDGLTDSPYFRVTLQAHERELDRTNSAIKHLIKDIKDLIAAARNLSRAQRTLSETLNNFNFECIGNSQTDDEMVIANSFKDFARLLSTIEDERDRLLEKADEAFLEPIERFRRDQIGSAKEAKKKFDKETAKYCQNLERYLNLSIKKSETQLQEADANYSIEQWHFFQAMSEYVLKLQEVNERKKFEFVETVLSFMLGWLTFYHQGHEIATDFYSAKMELQMRLQRTRNNFNMTQEETKSLRHKMLSNKEKFKQKFQDSGSYDKMYTRQGYLFLMEKKAFSTSWTKHFCQYEKSAHRLSLIQYTQTMGKIISTEEINVKECIRRNSDSIDRRFCFDIVTYPEDKSSNGSSNSGHNSGATTNGFTSSGNVSNGSSSINDNATCIVYTFQALSEEDYKLWLDAMDGRDPYPYPTSVVKSAGKQILSRASDNSKNATTTDSNFSSYDNSYVLDEEGHCFVRKCIESIDSKGLEQKGIYRIVGVTSRVRTLMDRFIENRNKSISARLKDRDGLSPNSNIGDEVDLLPDLNLESDEFESKTITSALKNYLRHLSEPIMTFQLHSSFISSAKLENRALRIERIHLLVHRLPALNFKVLKILIEHLQKVSKLNDKNLMTASNLGVCFGPTLLRTAEESVAAILDIKFVNVIAELLIENYEKIFLTKPAMLSAPEDSASNVNAGSDPANYIMQTNNNNSGGGNQVYETAIQQRPLPHVPLPLLPLNSAQYGMAPGILNVSQMVRSPDHTNGKPLFTYDRYGNYHPVNVAGARSVSSSQMTTDFSFYGNRPMIPVSGTVRRSSSQDQLYSVIPAMQRNRQLYSTTSNNTPISLLHVQHSHPAYAAYSQQQQQIASSPRKSLHLSTSTPSPSPSSSISTPVGFVQQPQSSQNPAQSHLQPIYQAPLAVKNVPLSSTSPSNIYGQIRSSNQYMQPSISYQNLHYQSELSGYNDNGKGGGHSNQAGNLPYNRPMTSIGILPINSAYSAVSRSDNVDSLTKAVSSGVGVVSQPIAGQQQFLAPINCVAPNASLLQPRQFNIPSTSSTSLPSTPEHSQQPSQFPYRVQQQQSQQTSLHSPIKKFDDTSPPIGSLSISDNSYDPVSSNNELYPIMYPHNPPPSVTNHPQPQSIYGSIGPQVLRSPNISASAPAPLLSSAKVRTRYVCIGGRDGELSFQPNMIITNVRNSQEPGWLEGNLNGKTGLIPLNYVEFIE